MSTHENTSQVLECENGSQVPAHENVLQTLAEVLMRENDLQIAQILKWTICELTQQNVF